MIKEIEKTHFDIIDDGYAVKVHLKNDIVFAFAHIERLQSRQITDPDGTRHYKK